MRKAATKLTRSGSTSASVGGFEHQGADRVVAAQVSPDLLLDELGRLRPQHRAGAALVGLQLVEGGLDLPPLGVGGGELGGRRLVGVERSW